MHDILTMNYPASCYSARWREAIALGNGHIGASVYGAVGEETILINHEALWADTVRPDLPDVSDLVPKVRRLLADNQTPQAQDVLTQGLRDRGYRPRTAFPLPLCDLKIKTPVRTGFHHYQRQLDMDSGVCTVCWQDNGAFQRRAFVSRQCDLLAVQLKGDLAGTVLRLEIHDKTNAAKPFGRPTAALPDDPKSETVSETELVFRAGYRDCLPFGAVLRVARGICCARQDALVLGDCTEAVLLIRPCVAKDIETALAHTVCALRQITEEFDPLLEAHAALHRALYRKTVFSLYEGEDHSNESLLMQAFAQRPSLELLEKLWKFGRYLLIASSDKTGCPCSLLGLWHGDYRALWAFNMLNENMQMTYWAARSGNLTDLEGCLFDYYDSMMDDFRENARKIFGCRGIFVPAVTTPGVGTIQVISRHILNWTAGAAWLAQHYYDHYLYTGDEEFLKKRALPFMREAAAFYLDFFTIGADGYYVSAPSVSPENSPANHMDLSRGYYPEVTINATMDFACAKELFTNLAACCARFSLESEERIYRQALTHIPPYQKNETGAVREWMHAFYQDNDNHRHQSHLYPLFPGREITPEDPRRPMFEQAVFNRLKIGISAQTSWSLVHMAHVWARLRRGADASVCLEHLMRCFVMNNLFTVHNDWRNMGIGLNMPEAPFQIDANMGLVSAVNEMLVSSDQGVLRLFPALPKEWQRGSMQNLLAIGGIAVSLFWDGQCLRARLTSPRDQTVQVYVACHPAQTVSLKAHAAVSLGWPRD